MVDRGNTPLRRIAVRWSLEAGALVCLVLVGRLLWIYVIKDLGDFTKVPLDRSPFLRDVAEPIAMIKGRDEAASDSVWLGVTFRDGRNVERYAEYVITSYAGEEIHDTLLLGRKKVPAGGAEERAFLGLLQRWYRQDAEARKLTDPPRRHDFAKLTEQQQAKVIGAAMMRILLKRNW